MEDFMLYFGEERACCVSRELTKLYEENQRGSLREVCEHFRLKGVKGEIVIVVEGAGDVRKKGTVVEELGDEREDEGEE